MNIENNRRRGPDETRKAQPVLAGVPVREDDIAPTLGLHWVAWMFRALAALVFVLMLLQLVLGLTSTVDLSYGVLFAEAVRMLILACLLWAAGALGDLFVRSHHDLRATRVLLARIAYRLREDTPPVPAPPARGAVDDRDDAGYSH
ncbi:MAG: hypothetical protein M3Q55_08025 [Acidobacteriota bacterium]|nr:hypothetical protein [Acidobacteriota bacterium]